MILLWITQGLILLSIAVRNFLIIKQSLPKVIEGLEVVLIVARSMFQALDIYVAILFCSYFVYFKDLKLKNLRDKRLDTKSHHIFHMLLIPILTFIYLSAGILDFIAEFFVFY